MWVRLWLLGVFATCLALLVVPDFGGCSGPTAHWVVLEPVAAQLGVQQHFRADGVFGPWIGLVGLGVFVGLAAVGWGASANARAREADQGRGEALLIGASGVWLAISSGWAWWVWPGV